MLRLPEFSLADRKEHVHKLWLELINAFIFVCGTLYFFPTMLVALIEWVELVEPDPSTDC